MRLTLLILSLLAASPAFAQGNACDRACLDGTVDRFLDAFVKHDPTLVPLTRTVKFTENGQKLPVGDGSWRTMVGKGTYRLFVTDPKAGQVAFIGTLREENQQRGESMLVDAAVEKHGHLVERELGERPPPTPR